MSVPRPTLICGALAALLALPVSAQTVHEALLLPGDLPAPPSGFAEFGSAAALQGNLLVVGAARAAGGQGRLYLYERDGVSWTFAQELAAASPSPFNVHLGTGLALDGALLVATSSERVLFFRRSGGRWTQEGELPTALDDADHHRISVQGDVAAICVPSPTGLFLPDVSIFRRTAGVWALEDTISSLLPSARDVAFVDAETLLVGWVTMEDLGNETEDRTYLSEYTHDAGDWSGGPIAGLPIGLYLGDEIAVRGELAVSVGFQQLFPIFPPGPGTTDRDLAVLERVGGSWQLAQELPEPPVAKAVPAFSADDEFVLLGASFGSPIDAEFALYRRDAGLWSMVQQRALEPAVPANTSLGAAEYSLAADEGHFVASSFRFDTASTGDGAAFVFRTSPFGSIESGALAGTAGLAPTLVGSGALTGGDVATVALSDALPLSTTALLSGLGLAEVPFKGGVLVPVPNLIFNGLLALPVNAAGERTLMMHWPVGVPAGTKLYLQHWVVDAAGPLGYSASNGLELVAQ